MNVSEARSGPCEKATVKLESIEMMLERAMPCHITSVCRICLGGDRMMKNIFESTGTDSIRDRILHCTGVKFSQEEGLSDKICTPCIKQLIIAQKFKTKCMSADDTCRKFLKDLKTIEASIDVRNVNVARTENVIKVEVEPFIEANDDFTNAEQDNGDNEIKVEIEPLSEADDDFKNVEGNHDNEIKVKLEPLSEASDDFENVEEDDDGVSDSEMKPMLLEKCSPAPKKKNINRFRRLVCKICNIGFKTKAECEDHRSKMHKDNESYVCKLCGKFFSNYKSHRSHLESHEEATNACTVCDYKSPFKDALKKHMWIHTGKKKYQCELCSVTFSHASNLLSHTKNKHREDRGSKQFQERSQLKRHLASHDRIKRHVCDVCKASFTRRCYWEKHLLDEHNVAIPTTFLNVMLQEEQHTNE